MACARASSREQAELGAGVLARQAPFEEVSGLKREARPDRAITCGCASPASHEAA